MLQEPSLVSVISSSAEETIALGEKLAAVLPAGSIVALNGGLGAGKTTLVKGIARALGIEAEITSPTYTIISEYEGKIPLYHIDAYRLAGDEDFFSIGGTELLSRGDGLALIEWSERISQSLPSGSINVEIEILEGDKRRIFISGVEFEALPQSSRGRREETDSIGGLSR
ncbi:MAG: tRNA (adenosine(37)-N6)-threonylcarbamoyltransferase complex ATPase subunit type 1 TsaE [Treponema sp.]|jgi:tRNA threonylcarbamoyladenosine biosynthesis protein TsaE|nr:tRNA (adenosine(37)-N6)-threonylcarbamoyltransferase complex ATPase subunit type 1 TsaE [Treponema sp.]